MAEPVGQLTPTYVFQTFKDTEGKTWAWQGSDLRYVQLIDSEQIIPPSDQILAASSSIFNI